MRTGWLYFFVGCVHIFLVLNLVAFCGHVTELTGRPVGGALWATWSWLLILVNIWTISLFLQDLRYRRARNAGPPRVWANQPGSDPVELVDIVPMGIDPLGSPAWLVHDVVLPQGCQLKIAGMTRHAALYVAVTDGAIVRLERGRSNGSVLGAVPGSANG